MTKKKLLYILLLLPVWTITYAQTYQLKPPFDIKEKMEVLSLAKELFDINANLSYNISNQDPIASFSKVADQEPYDVSYLQKLKKIWEADTSHPIYANQLGNYYNFHEKFDSAALFFRKAIAKLDIKYFNNDSAFYLSMRGTLKLNLGLENAIADFDQAFKINANDSIARSFYPLVLMNNRDFKKASEVCILMLNDPKVDPVFPYVMLVSSELFGASLTKLQEANADEKIRLQYISMDYNKLLDFTVVDKYAEKYKTNIEVRNARYMADIFALTIKLAFFKELSKPEAIFPYSVNEKAKLASLENIFLAAAKSKELNPYTLNKCLGFVYFMQQKKDKAIVTFNEAIKAFPQSKKSQYFNPAEMYDALSAVYYLNKDTIRFRQILIDKIAAEPAGKKDVKDYYLLAEHYLHADDLKKAEEWSNKGAAINANDFDLLRLLAHLNFLNGKNDVVQSYADKAIKLVQTNEQQYNLVLQFAFYQLFNGDPTSAYNNIEVARKSTEGLPCELCDRVVGKYIVITK